MSKIDCIKCARGHYISIQCSALPIWKGPSNWKPKVLEHQILCRQPQGESMSRKTPYGGSITGTYALHGKAQLGSHKYINQMVFNGCPTTAKQWSYTNDTIAPV